MPADRGEDGVEEGRGSAFLWNWFVLAASALVFIGFCNVYSSTFYMNLENGVSPYYHVIRHAVYCALGLALAWIIRGLPFGAVTALKKFLVGLSLFLLMAIPLGCGMTVNGATRWINLGFFTVQPSEIAKVAAILWTASGLAVLGKKGIRVSLFDELFYRLTHLRFFRSRSEKTAAATAEVGLLRLYGPLFVPLVFAALVEMQPDMGTAVLIFGFPVLLYFFCGLSLFDILFTLGSGAALACLMVQLYPYRLKRILVLWDPFSYAGDEGYQTVQSLIAVGSGGFLGQGAGEGLAKFLYLPEQHTDFAYAILSQEGGFCLAAFILLLFLAFLLLGFGMAGRIPDTFASLTVYGLTMLIGLEAFLNIAMVLGAFPVTGVPLPFISFGGSSLVMNFVALGIIGSAVRYGEKLRTEKEKRRKWGAYAAEPPSLRKLSGAVFTPPADERFKNF